MGTERKERIKKARERDRTGRGRKRIVVGRGIPIKKGTEGGLGIGAYIVTIFLNRGGIQTLLPRQKVVHSM